MKGEIKDRRNTLIYSKSSCDPTSANEAVCLKLILSYEQKCKFRSKFLKN